MIESLLSKIQNPELAQKGIVFDFYKDSEIRDLYELFLEIIKEGKSYPQTIPFSFEEFLNYFNPSNSKVLICKKNKEIIGGCYIKPNFPGRCSHIANCGYIVKKEYRGQKIGFYLGKCSIDIAKGLGYRSIIFNLVFKENKNAVSLWQKLGFKIIGTIPGAVKHNDEKFYDAYIMFLKLD